MAMNPVQQTPPQGVGAQNFTPASLYVGDLKVDVSETLLFDAFSTVGPVASIRVCRDVVSRKSLGYAYVNFHSVNDAERALDTMNFSMIMGRPCRIMWSQRDPSLRKSGLGNIFVKNLDKSIDHKTLYDTFSMFGSILSCKVATNDQGESLGYGFVHYESQDSANKAIQKVNGMVIAGREVHVAPFKAKSQRNRPNSEAAFTNVYVKGLKKDEIDDDKLQEMFKPYGEITSSYLARDDEGKPRGFGFVNFKKNEEAAAAVAGLNGKDDLYVGRAQKKEERERELREKNEQRRLQLDEKYAGVNLYIKNLDDTVDDEALKAAFAPYGEITSAKVMRDSNGRSKGFGFVCYSSREEAAKGVAEMNGTIFKQKRLYVGLAQRKEQRRQTLEAQAHAQRHRGNHQMATPHPHQMYGGGHPGAHQGGPGPQMFYHQGAQAAAGMPGGPAGGPGGAPHHGGGPQGGPHHGGPPGTPMGVNPQVRGQQPYMFSPGPHQAPMMGGPNQPGVGGPRGWGAQQGGPRGAPNQPNMMMRGGPQGNMYPMGNQMGMPQGGRGMGGGRGRGRGGRGGVDRGIQFQQGVRNQQQQHQQVPPQGPPAGVANGVPPQGGAAAPAAPQSGAAPAGGAAARPQSGAAAPAGGAAAGANANAPLTSQALAAATTQQQKQMIGERIYPKIQEREPSLAGKITGMLLEMDNTELLHLLESPDALNAKINEAMTVLQQSGDAPAPGKDAAPAEQQGSGAKDAPASGDAEAASGDAPAEAA